MREELIPCVTVLPGLRSQRQRRDRTAQRGLRLTEAALVRIPVTPVGAPVPRILEEGSAGCGRVRGSQRTVSRRECGGAALSGVRVQMSGWSSRSPVCSHRNLLKTGSLSVSSGSRPLGVGIPGARVRKMGLLFKGPSQ